MTPTNPGEYRVPATYELHVSSKDSLGQQIKKWEPVFTAFLAVRPLSGRELYYAQATRNEMTHRVALRYRPGVSTEGRFKLSDGRVLRPVSVLNINERDTELVCMAIESPGVSTD